MSNDKTTLEVAIRKAFADVSAPADQEIITFPGDYEADQFYNSLVGKTWAQFLQELIETEDDGNVRYFHAVYGFLTPVAFHYYLPAFMIISLDPVRADVTCESLLFALSPMHPAVGRNEEEWWIGRFSAFTAFVTPAQREAIRSFILYLTDLTEELEMGDITRDDVLRRYWFPEGFPRPARVEMPWN